MIYVNGRFLTQPMTGVERYAYKMCKALASQGQEFTIICPQTTIQSCYDVSDLQIIHYGLGNSHLWEQCVLPFYFIGKKNYLIFSFTGLGSILVSRKVMTIHDLSFLENPKWFSKAYYWWYKVMTPLAVKTSKRIITVSEFSKKEIIRFYPFLKENQITVAHSAVDKECFKPQNNIAQKKERFALAVSSMDPRKNFSQLIQAFADIKDCKLYIVGSHNRVFTHTTAAATQNEHIKFLGRVSDEKLVSLYNSACCFIFPSIYEGFGLPPLEAMSCGCPVLASDIPVIHEVCGDAAIYFNPFDCQNIRDTIQYYLKNEEQIKSGLREKGYQRINQFSWENSSKAIMQLAKELS